MWDELRYRWRLRQYLKSRPVVSSSTTNVAGPRTAPARRRRRPQGAIALDTTACRYSNILQGRPEGRVVSRGCASEDL